MVQIDKYFVGYTGPDVLVKHYCSHRILYHRLLIFGILNICVMALDRYMYPHRRLSLFPPLPIISSQSSPIVTMNLSCIFQHMPSIIRISGLLFYKIDLSFYIAPLIVTIKTLIDSSPGILSRQAISEEYIPHQWHLIPK